MSATLGDFHTLVAGNFARGTALNTTIPSYVRMAAKFLEENYTFKYMETLYQVTPNPDAAYPHVLDAPPRVKHYGRGKILDDTGEYHPIVKCSYSDVKTLPTARPKRFWLDGIAHVVLDAKPSESEAIEIPIYQFTDWPTAVGGTPWLVLNADHVLLPATLMLMSAFVRDPRLIPTYEKINQLCLTSLIGSMCDLEDEGTDMKMEYGVRSQP